MSCTPSIYLNVFIQTHANSLQTHSFLTKRTFRKWKHRIKCPVLKGKHQRASTQLLSNDADDEDSWPNSATLKFSDWNKTHLSWQPPKLQPHRLAYTSQYLCAFGTVHTTPSRAAEIHPKIKSKESANRRDGNSVQVCLKTVALCAVHALNSSVLRKSTSNARRRMFELIKRDQQMDGSFFGNVI